eukprot:jgi/Orpsp1_1/1190521/evm.model.d7180000079524.1
MASDEKIYPVSSEEEEQLINAPENAYVKTRAAYPDTQMAIPYAEQQATGSYQAPANPDKTAYTYTNPFTNTTNTYDTSAQYSNPQSYPVDSNGNNTSDGKVEGDTNDKDAASSLCTLCCGITL